MKYNIGDKVIDVNQLKFIGNDLYYKKSLQAIHTVRYSGKRLFSIYANAEPKGEIPGCNEYLYNHQATGGSLLYGGKTLLHCKKDKTKIIAILMDIARSEREESFKTYEKIFNQLTSQLRNTKESYKRREGLIQKNVDLIINNIEEE